MNGKGGGYLCKQRFGTPTRCAACHFTSWCIGNNAEFVWIALRSTGFPVIEEHWLSVSGLVER